MNIKYTKPDTRSETQKNIDKVKSELDHHLEIVSIKASIAWAQYSALRKEGFTEAQALKILIAHPDFR